jgi:acyl-CoA synthetase (AMP-forming)/AMP-acid ligase II
MFVDFQELTPAAKPDVGSAGHGDICHVLFTSGSTGIPKGTRSVSCLGTMLTLINIRCGPHSQIRYGECHCFSRNHRRSRRSCAAVC